MRDEAQTTNPVSDQILRVLTEALLRRLGKTAMPMNGIDKDVDLIEFGVVDSQGLLDIIFEVEAACGRVFDPERIDLTSDAITLGKIAAAFAEEP